MLFLVVKMKNRTNSCCNRKIKTISLENGLRPNRNVFLYIVWYTYLCMSLGFSACAIELLSKYNQQQKVIWRCLLTLLSECKHLIWSGKYFCYVFYYIIPLWMLIKCVIIIYFVVRVQIVMHYKYSPRNSFAY